MSFFRRLGASFSRMMQGRNGMDYLSYRMLWTGLVISLLDTFIGTGILSLLGFAMYIYAIVRMFSKNVAKRQAENDRFTAWWENTKKKFRQFFLRVKNSREYKYFHCPQCKVLIRLRRGSGETMVHCPKCGNDFRQKA